MDDGGQGLVGTGHTEAIRQLVYRHPSGARVPVETMTFADLRERDRGATQRADFHVLALVERGSGEVMLDFAPHPLTAGDAVWIGPGVVHRWSRLPDMEGLLVLFTPDAPVTDR